MYYYESNHPVRENLISVSGTVMAIKIGDNGSSTYFKIETNTGINKYSSYYGKVWPGMESIRSGDELELLAEINRLNKNEILEGKSYYIWELKHNGKILVNYGDVTKLVSQKEYEINRFINYWLVISFFLLLFALIRRDMNALRM